LKIAIPMDENQKNVCVSFGRAPYFLFHDTDTNTAELLSNPAASATGGAGIQAAQFAVDNGANALITVRLGQNAADVLLAADIKVYKAAQGSAEENLASFSQGKLQALESFHPGFHGNV